ncbi:proteasome accessory factor PafA2 family protein [Patescibacteria group bacterium]|nr:proteasome accessory factor PafA2 family protein [Patescibacteria group bacterium]
MKYNSKAVPPYMGEEVEWAILIRNKRGMYRLPTYDEFGSMINVFRAYLKIPIVDGKENFFENTKGLSGNEDWRVFLEKLKRYQLRREQGFLPSGFRYYVDGHHLELSSPGCCTLKDLIVSSKAGEKILNFSRKVLEEKILPEGYEVKVFKDTSNRKGTSFAGHENYLINRETFHQLTDGITKETMQLASFFAVRVPLCGAGQVSIDRFGNFSFQISQRAGFIERILSLDTTFLRPLINTRDEPHADFVRQNGVNVPVKRLHVICGEPNMSSAGMKMRFGTALNFLQGIQDDIFYDIQDDIVLKDPVRAMKIISSDVGIERTVELADGRKVKFFEILRTINNRLRWYFDEIREPTQEQREILDEVDYYCDAFEKGTKYYMKMLLPELDWINRFDVCSGILRERRSNWTKLGEEEKNLVYFNDLSYADIDPVSGLYYAREREYKKEGLIKKEFSESEIRERIFSPPTDNREYLKGNILKMFPGLRNDWEMILLPSNKVLWLGDPFRGSKEEMGDFSRFFSEDALIKELKSLGFKLFDRR